METLSLNEKLLTINSNFEIEFFHERKNDYILSIYGIDVNKRFEIFEKIRNIIRNFGYLIVSEVCYSSTSISNNGISFILYK